MPALRAGSEVSRPAKSIADRALGKAANGSSPVWLRAPCHYERRPLLDHLGVETEGISGSLARLLVLLTVIAPYELGARLACLLLGVEVSAMGVWRVTLRLGEAAAQYQEEVTRYHDDSRSPDSSAKSGGRRGGRCGWLGSGEASPPAMTAPTGRRQPTACLAADRRRSVSRG